MSPRNESARPWARESALETAHDLARNMSAPPRSTVSFRPYGTTSATTPAQALNGTGGGLRWIFRVHTDSVLKAHLPDLAERMGKLRSSALDDARGQDKESAAHAVSQVRSLRLAGLLSLAAILAGEDDQPSPDALAEVPVETLLDRLSDLARRMPIVRSLPALAFAERWCGLGLGRTATDDPHAALWVLTHLNGRTFDRDGAPLLAPDLAEGGAWDLYAP